MSDLIIISSQPKRDLFLLVDEDVDCQPCLHVGITPEEYAWWCALYDQFFILGKDAFTTLNAAVTALLNEMYQRQQKLIQEIYHLGEKRQHYELLKNEGFTF